jgi:hypothetical protein
MSQALVNLKLINAKRNSQVDPIQFRRKKLTEKLSQQIEMAQALSRGEEFKVKRFKKITDESGQSMSVEVNKRVKTWWFTNSDTKKVAVQLYYGNKLIDLAKGKNAIEVSDRDELIQALTKLRDAVLGGELDAQIEIASESVKARFKK